MFGPSNTQYYLQQIQGKMIEQGLELIKIDQHSNADGKGLIKLINQRYSLYFVNSELANYRIKNLQLQGIENKGSYKSLEYHIGFAKAYINKRFIVRFNRAILQLSRRSAFKVIWQKWQKWQSRPGNIEPCIYRN
ncbi:MAG: hypothetical protein MJK10_00580 [Pseudomonadales bacterium]|nr:hypothetical protein [Pseudomonadales bacterium]NRA14373.1 hypothetical protein [Oceanospirillaceae bacterium]